MKLENLTELGLEQEMAEKVLTAVKKELEGFIPQTRFNEVNEEKKNLASQVELRDTQIAELKKSTSDNAELQKQIEAMQTASETQKTKYETEIKSMRVKHSAESALLTEKAKNTKAVLPFLSLDEAEIGEDGNIVGLSEQIKALKENEATSFLFEASAPTTPSGIKGAEPKPSSPGGETKPTSYEDFCKLYK